MRNDIGSNFEVTDGLDALSRTAGTYYGDAIDHSKGSSGSFHVSCGVWATSLVATLQHCATDSATPGDWTDEADTTRGNTVSVTLTEAGEGEINVPNPRARFSRVKLVVGGTCVASVTNHLGPLKTLN